jgi:hypothetical protein
MRPSSLDRQVLEDADFRIIPEVDGKRGGGQFLVFTFLDQVFSQPKNDLSSISTYSGPFCPADRELVVPAPVPLDQV